MRDQALIAFLKHIFRLAIPAFFRFTDERNICKPEEGWYAGPAEILFWKSNTLSGGSRIFLRSGCTTEELPLHYHFCGAWHKFFNLFSCFTSTPINHIFLIDVVISSGLFFCSFDFSQERMIFLSCFSWLYRFSRYPTLTTRRIFVQGFCSLFLHASILFSISPQTLAVLATWAQRVAIIMYMEKQGRMGQEIKEGRITM